MIIRIVRMSFDPEKVDQFLDLFNSKKENIRLFPGCQHLELHRDVDTPNVFATYSYWEKKDDLEAYRHSDLFKEVWANTKLLFNGKPQAFSHERVMLVEPNEPGI